MRFPLPVLMSALLLLVACSGGRSNELVVSGRVERDDAHVGSKVGGRVERVLADEGELVKPGQPLVVLDDKELRAQLAQAQGSAAQAQAQLDLLLAGTRREDIAQQTAVVQAQRAQLELRRKGFRTQEVREAEARVASARSELNLARKELDRAQQLLKDDAVSQQQVDARRNAYLTTQAQLKQAEEQLALLRSGSRPEEIAQAEAQLAQAEAELERLRNGARPEEVAAQRAALEAARANIGFIHAQLAETTITAPLAATVETLELYPGDLVRAGDPVAILNLTTNPYIRCYVPENRLGYVRAGKEVAITVDSFKRRFKGIIRRVSSDAEFTPRNVQTTEKRAEQVFEMKVDVVEGGDLLRPGMYADVHISLEKPS